MHVVGVDGCPGGWIAVALTNGRFAGASCYARFAQLIDEVGDVAAIAVDIPIGLMTDGARSCDALARDLIGPRRSSVFMTPPRRALEAATYDEANALCRMLTESGLSRQAYGLRAKIFEVDEVVHGERGRRIIEVHPEVCFREMAGRPLAFAKKSYNGMMLRMGLLAQHGIVVPGELDQVGGVSVDDVFDAAAAAWTAQRYAERRAKCLPPRELMQRDGERGIAIWI